MRVLAIVAALVLCGCDEVKTEYGPDVHEQGKVQDLLFSPSKHWTEKRSGVRPRAYYDFFEDEWKTRWESYDYDVPVTVPEDYGVVFACQHGNFVSHGPDARHKDLWGRMKKDADVIIRYREVYEVLYRDGKKASSKLVKYDFLDAQPGVLPPEEPGK